MAVSYFPLTIELPQALLAHLYAGQVADDETLPCRAPAVPTSSLPVVHQFLFQLAFQHSNPLEYCVWLPWAP